MLNEYKIIWEKWSDPFGIDNNVLPFMEDEDDEQIDSIIAKKNHVLVTSMGIVPYNETTDCSQIFNFWIGHTNFNISNHIANIIQNIDGVETLDIFTRYRFRVAFGKAFVDRDVMNRINTIISQSSSNYNE